MPVVFERGGVRQQAGIGGNVYSDGIGTEGPVVKSGGRLLLEWRERVGRPPVTALDSLVSPLSRGGEGLPSGRSRWARNDASCQFSNEAGRRDLLRINPLMRMLCRKRERP